MSTRRPYANWPFIGFMLAVLMASTTSQQAHAQVRLVIKTTMGDIAIAVDSARAPVTAQNFLSYVDAGHYKSSLFHRTVTLANQPSSTAKIEVIQASVNESQSKKDFAPVLLERTNVTGIRHLNGTLSMARSTVNSATSSFFICIGDQPELDFGGKRNADGQGFAAFGTVTSGMDVVRAIHTAPANGQTLSPLIEILDILRVPVTKGR